MYRCRARGIFRKDGVKPLVGDLASFEVTHEQDAEGNVVHIHQRSSRLYRPAVANVDQALVVFALKSPDPVYNLLDRFLVLMEQQGLSTVLAFNKCDLVDADTMAQAGRIYENSGASVVFTSIADGRGLDEVEGLLKGHITVLAGPSGAGKSSMINALSGREHMETGEVSPKIGRGRQTTRHVELIDTLGGSCIIDTPGFSSLELEDIEPRELGHYFPEIDSRAPECFFKGCAHLKEPGCAVLRSLEEGDIAPERYSSYCMIYDYLSDRRAKSRKGSGEA